MKLKHHYYHERIHETLRFIIPQKRRVLHLGCYEGDALNTLSPSFGVGVDISKENIREAKKKYSNLVFDYVKSYDEFSSNEKYDYIILSGVLGETNDILRILAGLKKTCHSSTRIIVYQHNYLWGYFLKVLEKFKLKRKEGIQNWLSVVDVKTYLFGAGYDSTRVFRRTLLPVYFFGFGPLVNNLGVMIPFVDFLKLDQFVIAKPRDVEIVKSWIPGTDIEYTMMEVREIEKEIDRLRKLLSEAKKRVAHAMLS